MAMYKMVIVIYRNPAVPFDEAIRWWTEEHFPIAKKIPGLIGYVVNIAQREVDGKDPAIMGTDEIYFESWETAEAAYRSAEWAESRAHTQAAGHTATRCNVEEVRIIDPR
jgi:uncharacterized protein (TIGR02118 family)